VLSSGRVLYTRWEYTDGVHCHSRLLFHMNPDGTEQLEYYKSNSYWPNALFYARPIPRHPTKVVAVISGHHGVARMGELVIFDPALGRQGQRGRLWIPGRPQIRHRQQADSWPVLHLTVKRSISWWRTNRIAVELGNLVDVFDNMLLISRTTPVGAVHSGPRR
jgi:hypothetical protein